MMRRTAVVARIAATSRVGAACPIQSAAKQHARISFSQQQPTLFGLRHKSASPQANGFPIFTEHLGDIEPPSFEVAKPKSIAPGDLIPPITMDHGFNPIQKVNMAERTKGKKIPGYLIKEAELKEKGIDEVLVYCVNDGAVMQAWAKDQGIEGSILTFLADTRCEFTKAVGMCIDHPGPKSDLGNTRCKRFALVVDNGIVKHVEVSEGPDDPAGDNEPDGPITRKTLVENILTLL